MTAKPVTIFLIILVTVLTISTSYLYTKNKPSSITVTPVENAKDTSTDTTSTSETVAPTMPDTTTQPSTTKPSTTVNDGEASPLVNKNRASNPDKSYLVKSGETLYPIGLKFNLDWTIIAKANGLSDSNNIQAGIILVIPDYDVDTKKITINYSIDTDKATTLEKNISLGKELWRQDPLEVAKKETYPCFKLSSTDTFTLGSKNIEKGIAQVSAVKDNLNYEIGLVQPVTKTADGIWTISYVKEI